MTRPIVRRDFLLIALVVLPLAGDAWSEESAAKGCVAFHWDVTQELAVMRSAPTDMIADGAALESIDHQGAPGCDLVHKIVEFDLPAKQLLVLQLSGRAERLVGLAITAVNATAH